MSTFTNTNGITIIDNGTVSQTIVASGIAGPVGRIAVTITGLTHTSPADLDFLLVGPDGVHNLLFWSDAGDVFDLNNATVTVADSGVPLPSGAPIVDGTTHRPADYAGLETDSDFGSATGGINHPGPNGSASFSSAFNGLLDPNGTWTLYVHDDTSLQTGTITSWTLDIDSANILVDGTAAPDTLIVSAGANFGSYSFDGGADVSFNGATSFSFNGQGGDDALTIVNPSKGLFQTAVSYDGGGQPGDVLQNVDGRATAGSYTVGGAGSGTLAHQANEHQQITVFAGVTAFMLTFKGQTTGQLASNADPAAVQAALNALSSIGGVGGSVAVTGAPGAYDITFGGTFANVDVPLVTPSPFGGGFISVSPIVQGGTQSIAFTGLAPVVDTITEDTFTITGSIGADAITITDGGIVGGQQMWLISSPSFESISVANKTTIIIDGNGGGDTVSMDTATIATGLQTLIIFNVDTVTQTQPINVANLRVDAANALNLTGANDVDTFSAHLTNLNASIDFRDLDGFAVDGITTNGGPVTLVTDTGPLTVGTAAANSGIDVGNNIVRLQATNGDINQVANGAILAGTLGARAGGSVALTALNHSAGLTIAANDTVNYRDSGDVKITAIGPSGLFTATVSGISSLDDDINLGVGGNLRLNTGTGQPAIDAGTADIRIVAGGTVDQSNANDSILGDEVGIIAGGAVTLATGNNDVNALAVSTNGPVAFRDIDDMIAAQVLAGGSVGYTGATGITSQNHDIDLKTGASLTLFGPLHAGSGDVRLAAGGTTSQGGGGEIVADALGAIVTAGGIDLTTAAANDVNTLAMSGGTVARYTDADDLTIGAVAAGGSTGFAGATGISGQVVAVSSTGALTVANDILAGFDITLAAGDTPNTGDDLTVNAGVQVNSGGGQVTLHAGDDLEQQPGSNISAFAGVQASLDFGNADAGVGGNGIAGVPHVNGALFMSGGSDGDTLTGGSGADTLNGGAGDDRFVWNPGDGSDFIDGGADNDTLAFNGAGASETFALGAVGSNALLTRDIGGVTMTLTSVERLELQAGDGLNQFSIANLSGTGLTGTIRYTGGSGVDIVNAAAAINVLNAAGGGGNDILVGGSAGDTAIYSGNLADYQLAFRFGAVGITDARPGSPDGTDTLLGIEAARFADGTVPFIFGTPGDDNLTALSGNEIISAGAGNDTVTFGFRLIDATVSYSGNAILIESGANHTVVSGFETYVFADGTVSDNDADPLVDDLFYYAQNHDVWSAHLDADQHYHQIGRFQNLDPNAFFSTSIYLSANADVKAAGADPLIHFDQNGWKEGRVPSLSFDPRQYLAANPDVAAAQVDPLAHFLQSGAQEDRLPFAPSELFAANGFDYVYYLQHNPDVAAAHVDPLLHFETVGWQEGRNPNALFDVNGYLNAYPDVAAARVNPLDHYHQSGFLEGRDPSVGFDTTEYLAHNPDVAAAHVDPLLHFLQSGIHEGRSPFADGVFG